jgi:hypothetical protein
MKIFLSHIHKEKDIAILIKSAIESEFSGFVEVFVSSDGISIPAGVKFLDYIEDALTECVAGIYLISPESVSKSWISFELGAVWIRNIINKRNKQAEIPALPMCHSGIRPSELPQPIGSLNAIEANNKDHLEFAFKSIQKAVGGKGLLRTDFSKLTEEIRTLEHHHTLGKNFDNLLKIIGITRQEFMNQLKIKEKQADDLEVKFGWINNDSFKQIKEYEKDKLKSHIKVKSGGTLCMYGPEGQIVQADTSIIFDVKFLKSFDQ